MHTRSAHEDDFEPLADLWWLGWHDAHADLFGADLTAQRTIENARDRVRASFSQLWLAGPTGAPTGFHLLKGDELNQFYVARGARGTGLAASLLTDAERRLAMAGHALGWLSCAIGNHRAARFYEKAGWRRTGVETITVELPAGPRAIEVWRYEKRLAD